MEAQLRSHVDYLARQPRPPASPWHAQTRAYIARHLEEAGFAVDESHDRLGSLPMINLLTRPLPDDPRLPVVIVGAHYDSIPGSPGADDNASAVAALLELARLFSPGGGLSAAPAAGPPLARLQFAAYDLEESGLLGSSHHAQALRANRTPVLGMIALEMLGYTDHRPRSQQLPPLLAGRYPDVGNFIGVVGNEPSRVLFETMLDGLRSIPRLPVEGLIAPGNGRVLPESRLSDHSSFWDAGIPALMITDTSFYRNPHYHAASDRPETLDYVFLARVTEGVAAGLRRLLHVPAV